MYWLIIKRKEKNLTQKKVAEMADISAPHLSDIENGKKRPSVEVAKRLGDIYDIPWTEFFENRASAFQEKAEPAKKTQERGI